MRNYSKTVGALAAASALVAGFASAEIEGEVHVGYTSEYLFRGLNLGQDLVEAGVDLSYELAEGLTLSGGAWYASFEAPTGFGNLTRNEDELDLYAEVSKDLGFATAAVGYIYYYYPQGSGNNLLLPIDDTQEVYFSLSRDFGFLEASVTYFWDIEGDNDGYAELALGKGFELNECLTLNVGSALGYYVEHSDFAHLTTTVSLDWAYSDTVTVSPFVAGSLSLSDSPRTLNFGAKDQFVGGVKLAVGF